MTGQVMHEASWQATTCFSVWPIMVKTGFTEVHCTMGSCTRDTRQQCKRVIWHLFYYLEKLYFDGQDFIFHCVRKYLPHLSYLTPNQNFIASYLAAQIPMVHCIVHQTMRNYGNSHWKHSREGYIGSSRFQHFNHDKDQISQ